MLDFLVIIQQHLGVILFSKSYTAAEFGSPTQRKRIPSWLAA